MHLRYRVLDLYWYGWAAPGSKDDEHKLLLSHYLTTVALYSFDSCSRHFEYERPGGRSSARATDLVRRRCWRRTLGINPGPANSEGDIDKLATHL